MTNPPLLVYSTTMLARWNNLIVPLLIAAGCGDDIRRPPPNGDADGDDTGIDVTEDEESGDAPGDESDESDGLEQDEQPPALDDFLVDASASPPPLEDAAFVELSVVATDDIGLDYVEFLDGDLVLGKLEAVPGQSEFTLTWLVSGAEFDGVHQLLARAVDLAGNVGTSSPIPLTVDQLPAGFPRWENTWDREDQQDIALACGLIQQGRLLVGGSAERADGVVQDAWGEAFSTTNGQLTGGWGASNVVAGDEGDAQLRAIRRFVDADDLALAGVRGTSLWVGRWTDDGTEVWHRDDPGTAGADDVGGIAAGFGVVHVAASSGSSGYLFSYDAATGIPIGQFVLQNGALRDVALLDRGGDVVVVGGRSSDVFVGRLTAAGEVVWSEQIDGAGGFDEAQAVSVGADGAIAVAGFVAAASMGLDTDTFVRVYEPDGLERWTAPTHDEASAIDMLLGVAMDPLGRVVVTGMVTPDPGDEPINGDIYVASYDPWGSLRWEQLPNAGTDTEWDRGRDVCLDELGNVYVVGEIFGSSASMDWWMARYAP